MKGKRKSDINVKDSREMKGKGGRRLVKVKKKEKKKRKEKVNVKNNYKKIGKKRNNDMDAEVAQLERSKNKCYTSAFRYIYRLIGYIKSFTKMIDFGTTFIRILHLLFFFFFFFFFFFIFFYFLFFLLYNFKIMDQFHHYITCQ